MKNKLKLLLIIPALFLLTSCDPQEDPADMYELTRTNKCECSVLTYKSSTDSYQSASVTVKCPAVSTFDGFKYTQCNGDLNQGIITATCSHTEKNLQNSKSGKIADGYIPETELSCGQSY